MKLKIKILPGLRSAEEVGLAVVSEDDGTTLSTTPLWRVIDGFLSLCSEIPEPEDTARLTNLADALEAQARRLRAAAGELNETNR